ncbi:MAG: hypothetical protein JWN62_850 [Acidimicrobiales bacterium]|nr:hypothetical protein [Acidimicrobiales bacterium]
MSDWNSGAGEGAPTPPGFPAPGAPAGGFLPPSQPVYAGQPASPPEYLGAPGATPLTAGPTPDPKRSRGKMLGALVGVVALVGAGTFAISQISSNGSSGGASSPKEVGTKLVSSLDGEDLLGVVDLLLPGERETLRQPLLDLSKELTRLQVVDTSVDLNKVPGFDISISNPAVSVDETNVSDIADVTVDASATVTINGKDLPIGKLLVDRVFGGDRPEVDPSPKDADLNTTFAAVKKDGRWYLSLFYTAAEHARGDQDIPEKGITPAGASSPDGALDDLIKAGADFDLEGIIASLNPNEAEALQRYAPLFTDSAQSMLDDNDVAVKVSNAEYTVSGSGDTRQVAISRLKVTASATGHDAEFSLQDGCVKGSVDATDFDSCAGDASTDESLDGYLNDLGTSSTPELKKFVEDVRSAFSDFSMHGVVVNKVDGKWFVSPIGTSETFVLSVLRALDRDEIDTLINDGGDALTSIFDGIFTGSTGDGTSTTDDTYGTTYPTDETYTTEDPYTTDTVTTDTATDGTATDGTTSGTDDSSYWFDCVYSGDATADAATCLHAGIDKGDYTAADVPAPFLFPECGLFDYYAGNDLYSDSAEKFHATVDPATDCIIKAAADAGVDLSVSSSEFAHPDCYAAINPYNFNGDIDAISAAYSCSATGG